MKLALIRRQFSAVGGAELYLRRLLPALSDAGHEVHLYSESWPAPPEGVTVHTLTIEGSRAEKPVRFALAVERELQANRHDVVFSLERTTRQDVYRAGDGVHATWLEQRRLFSPWWRKPWVGLGGFHRNMMALENQCFDPSRTGRIIANSAMVRDDIARRFRFPPDRIDIVRNGIDAGRLASGFRETTRAGWGIGREDRVLLFVGSGWERKGLKFLLKAFGRIRDDRMKLVVAGKGRPPASPPRGVIFAGPVQEVENAYAAADLFVFLPIYEPSSNVVIEALAAGLPVVTSRQNGAAELIREGIHGTVVDDPADCDTVGKAILHWIRQPRISAEIRQALDLSLDRNVRETLEVLEKARKSGRGGQE